MLKNTGSRTNKSKNKSWISTLFSHAIARDLKAFVVPGSEIARAYGLEIKAAGMQLVDSPRHASVLLIIGELTPAISEAATIIYAQMMRPRAVFILADSNSESNLKADIVTEISQAELISGTKNLKKIFQQSSFTLNTQDFSPDLLSIIKKYTCPMHPEILQDEPGSCPKCGMTLVIKEMNVGDAKIEIQPKETHSHTHHKHKAEQDNKTEDQYTCPMHPEVLQNKPGSCPKCGMFLVKIEAKENKQEHSHKHEHGHKHAHDHNKVEQDNKAEDQYTCPMHPEILQDKPGSCPKCGMTLVVRELNANENVGEVEHIHEQPQHSHHNHKKEAESDSSETLYTCPMHPEILQDKPGSCPKCGMFLEPVKAPEKPAQHEHMHHHEKHKDNADATIQYTCPMHPEVLQDKPGSCPKCGMFLVKIEAEENKQEHNHTSALKVDHSKMDHSKMDHSKMDHSKMDHSKMDHSKMDHSKMDHSEMSFMSMVDVTQDLPRSDDGLQMEWFDLPFGPFFPGLPAGLFLNFTLDGDTIADCQINQEYPLDVICQELPMHAGCFFKKVFALNPMIKNCVTVLIQKVVNNALEQEADNFTSKGHIATIEKERIVSHLSWFCQFGLQTGMHNLVRKAESLQLQLQKANFEEIMQQKTALNKFVNYILKIPMLKFRTQGIGKLSETDDIFGPVARSMNLDNDVRSGDAGYQQLNFKPILLNQGDAYARLKIRALEIQQSLELIMQAGLLSSNEITSFDDMTNDDITGKAIRKGFAQLESARGQMSLKMSFDAGKIQSFEMKTPSSSHIKQLIPLVKQQEIGDALIAIGSLDILPSEVHA